MMAEVDNEACKTMGFICYIFLCNSYVSGARFGKQCDFNRYLW